MFFSNMGSQVSQNVDNKKDLYTILQISKDATSKEIKTAYYTLAKEYHPDKSPGDSKKEEQFKDINEAYEVLSDKDKRLQYDMFHSMSDLPNMGAMGGIPFNLSAFSMPMNNMFAQIDPEVIQSIQSNLFTGLFGMSQPDLSSQDIPHQDVYEQEIFNSIHNLFGFPASASHTKSSSVSQKMPHKEMIIDIHLLDCYTCGIKQINIQRTILDDTHEEILELHIPKGVCNKKEIIFIEKGDQTKNYTIPGDLKIIINIVKDPSFKKYGNDIIYEKNILLSEALYGCSFDITLPNNKCLHFISKQIIQSRMTKQYKGLGFPNENNECGDLHILFIIEFPKTLLNKRRELLYKLLPKRKKTKTSNIEYDNIYTV